MKKMFLITIALSLIISYSTAFAYGLEVEITNLQNNFNQEAASNIIKRINEYVEPYLGTNTLTNYDNGRAIQCHAFTNYIWRNVYGYDVYSSKCKRTEASSDYEALGEYVNKYARPGDMLRVDGKHSIVITKFDSETVTGYDWISNKKERECTYTWEGVKNWGDGTQNYWLYQIDDSVYKLFENTNYKVSEVFGPETPESGGSLSDGNKADGDKTEPTEKSEHGKIVVQINNPVMTANGQYKNIDSLGTTPIIVNDRAILPIRAIVETMGGDVQWDNDTRTVGIKYKEVSIEMVIDNDIMKVNGQQVKMDVAPVIVNERTMLPIRYVTESFGGEIEWFDSIQAIEITYEI